MNKFLVVFVGMLAAAHAISFFDVVKEEWNAYKVNKNKFYFFAMIPFSFILKKNDSQFRQKNFLFTFITII